MCETRFEQDWISTPMLKLSSLSHILESKKKCNETVLDRDNSTCIHTFDTESLQQYCKYFILDYQDNENSMYFIFELCNQIKIRENTLHTKQE